MLIERGDVLPQLSKLLSTCSESSVGARAAWVISSLSNGSDSGKLRLRFRQHLPFRMRARRIDALSHIMARGS